MEWLLTRGRLPFLCILVAVTAWLGLNALRVDVERDNQSLNARDTTLTATYEQFRATFGSDEDLLLAVTHPQLLAPAGLQLIDRIIQEISALDGVHHVYGLTNIQQLISSDSGAQMAPLIDKPIDDPNVAQRVTAALDRNPDFTGLFVSVDRRTAGILIEIDDRPNDHQYRGVLIDTLRRLMATHTGDGVDLHLTGIAVQKNDVSEFIERDQGILIPLAVVVLGLVLATFFRGVIGVVLPLTVTGLSVVWTMGAYHLAGHSVNAITALLPPIIMVLSLAVSVHLMHGWLEAPDRGGPRSARIRGVVREIIFPCFFCTVTTAIGFGSLVTSDMPAVQQLGIFAAFAVVAAFCIGITLVPVGLTFISPPAAPPQAMQHRAIERALTWAADVSVRHPWRIVTIFGGLTALTLTGFPYIRNNTDLVRFLKADAPLYRDTMFIDRHLTGANTLEFVVARNDHAPLTRLDDVQRMAAFEQAILHREHVTGVSSVLAILRQLHRAESGSDVLALPNNERDTAQAFDLLEAAPDQDLIRKTIAPDFTRARFNVRIHAVGTAIAAPLADDILADGRRLLGAAYSVEATGAFYHIAKSSNQLVDAQVNSFSLALLLVVAAIGLLLRSLRLTFVALIPNVMPIIWTGGMMGFLGIDLSTGTAMIASAVIGLVVDDTIHYLAHYKRVFRGDADAAVRRTTTEVGMPLLVNNLVLVLGFWVGCFGSFKPTIYFSLLSGITMITALVCDLFVTPACLVLVTPRRAVTA